MSRPRSIGRMSQTMEDAVLAALQQQGQALARLQGDITRLLQLAVHQDRRMTRMELALGMSNTEEFAMDESVGLDVGPPTGEGPIRAASASE